jgi:hypothetical protein
MQQTTRSMQRATDDTQQTTCSVQHATDNAQHATCNRRHAADNVQRAACSRRDDAQHATDNVQQAACDAPQWLAHRGAAAFGCVRSYHATLTSIMALRPRTE